MTLKARFYRLLYPFHKFYRFIFRPESAGAGCVIEFQNKILLIRNTYGDGSWSFPGGGIKRGESAAGAAIRETKEEVGIDLGSVDELGTFLYQRNYYHDTIHVFCATVRSDYFKIDLGEIQEACWFTLGDVPRKNFSNIGRKIFEIYEKESGVLYSQI